MGIKSRHKRLEHFDQRVADFQVDLMEGCEGLDYRFEKRDGRTIVIGAGKHKRLCQKRNPLHASLAFELQEKFLLVISEGVVKPKNYVLERVRTSPDTGIQEFFNRPSVESLAGYLQSVEGPKPAGVGDLKGPLTRDERLLCKQLVNQQPGLTLERLDAARREFKKDLGETFHVDLVESNILALGVNRDGKVRLAIVDM